MKNLNRVTLIGRTGDDVKLHYFDNQNCLGRVSLATQNDYKNQQTGEEGKRTEWHNLTFRNKAAETVEKYCKKGSMLYVEGRLVYRSYEKEVVMFENYDDEGNKIFHWYSAHHCTHRSKLTGEVVRMDRYIGAERIDKDWYDTGMMSTETWGLYKGV